MKRTSELSSRFCERNWVSNKVAELQTVQLGKHLQKSLARTCVPKLCRFGSKIGKHIHHLVF